MTHRPARPPVVLCDDDPASHIRSLGAGWKLCPDLDLPVTPRDLTSRRWAWVADISEPADARRAVEALSRGVALVIRVRFQGNHHRALLEDLHALGDVRRASAGGAATVPRLAPDQVALLTALAAGTTVTDAARSLHLSRRTASRRLAESRELLGVTTNAEAITWWVDHR